MMGGWRCLLGLFLRNAHCLPAISKFECVYIHGRFDVTKPAIRQITNEMSHHVGLGPRNFAHANPKGPRTQIMGF